VGAEPAPFGLVHKMKLIFSTWLKNGVLKELPSVKNGIDLVEITTR